MNWFFPDGFVGDDPVSKRNAKWLSMFVLLFLLGGCAPMWIAAGVEIEHDEWCKTHQHDYHCR